MTISAHPDDFVTLTRLGDLTTAQLLCGRLEAEGIVSLIPDEHMATQTWHLHGAIGGVRVQVRQADLERAKEVLAQPGAGDAGEDAAFGAATAHRPNHGNGADDGSISAGDRAAFRALRVALVSLWLLGLIHPYSLWLAIRALGRGDLSDWGRRRARIALVISAVGCVWMVVLGYRMLSGLGLRTTWPPPLH